MYRIAMISVHSCPLATLGGKETGGMNVYIRELGRELAKKGLHIDIFTRSQSPSIPQIVTFLGAQRQDQLPFFYSVAEVCVLPSRYESFGMVALEAMACCTPVIASKVGGLTSFIQDELTGFLVPEEDEMSLAEKILKLLHHPTPSFS